MKTAFLVATHTAVLTIVTTGPTLVPASPLENTVFHVAATQSTEASPAPQQVLFNRYQAPVMTVFIADADGTNERKLVPTQELAYSPSYSADGRWIVFTNELHGQADIYRIHPDGTGLEQLTDDLAFDDQGVLSPDGNRLAFVSTRERGTADVWVLDLDTGLYLNLTNMLIFII